MGYEGKEKRKKIWVDLSIPLPLIVTILISAAGLCFTGIVYATRLDSNVTKNSMEIKEIRAIQESRLIIDKKLAVLENEVRHVRAMLAKMDDKVDKILQHN